VSEVEKFVIDARGMKIDSQPYFFYVFHPIRHPGPATGVGAAIGAAVGAGAQSPTERSPPRIAFVIIADPQHASDNPPNPQTFANLTNPL